MTKSCWRKHSENTMLELLSKVSLIQTTISRQTTLIQKLCDCIHNVGVTVKSIIDPSSDINPTYFPVSVIVHDMHQIDIAVTTSDAEVRFNIVELYWSRLQVLSELLNSFFGSIVFVYSTIFTWPIHTGRSKNNLIIWWSREQCPSIIFHFLNFKFQSYYLILMLLMPNLANTKSCKKAK